MRRLGATFGIVAGLLPGLHSQRDGGGLLAVNAAVTKTEFCRGDSETDLLWLTLTVRLTNNSANPILRPGDVRLGTVEVAKSAESLLAGTLEMSINVDELRPDAGVRPAPRRLPPLPPGRSFVVEDRIFLVVAKQGGGMPKALAPGAHALRVEVVPSADAATGPELDRQSVREGVRWIDPLWSPVIVFFIPGQRTYGSCHTWAIQRPSGDRRPSPSTAVVPARDAPCGR